jgi:hypothetical protein
MFAPEHLADALVVIIVAAKGVLDHRGGKRRDVASGSRLDRIDKNIDKLFGFIVGPDGQNGMRGDLRKVEDRVCELEDRELQRLERQRVAP